MWAFQLVPTWQLLYMYQLSTSPHILKLGCSCKRGEEAEESAFNPYPTAFPYGNGMVLHFYQQQESSTNKTVHKVINKGLKAYV